MSSKAKFASHGSLPIKRRRALGCQSMEYDTKSDLKVDKVFQQEHEHAKILLEDYAQTNAREYFACAIEEYFLNEEERHIFEQELPLTYALVEDILLNYA